MMESLSEVSSPLKFFLAFIFVLALIGVIAVIVRRFGAERFGGSSARGRQPRLAVVDVAAVDARRKLVIIRRDNVEHLLMIGGATDVVVEQNIVRAAGVPRDKVEPSIGRGLSASETLSRPVPLGEGSLFPLQPQPDNNGRAPRMAPEESAQWTWPAQPEPVRPPRLEPRPETRQEARQEIRPEIRPEPRPEPLLNPADESSARPPQPREPTFTRPPPVSRPIPMPAAPVAAPTPAPVIAPAPVVAPSPATTATAPFVKVDIDEKILANTDSDENLAKMANKLEAALRRPNEPRFTEPQGSFKAEPMAPPPRFTQPEPKAPRAEAKPAPKAVYDSLEEEMASLLGRPPGKS